MKEVKILIKNIPIFSNQKEKREEIEKEIENKLNEGFEIKSSNIQLQGNFCYIYVILERVV